jgi:hypothetical protein
VDCTVTGTAIEHQGIQHKNTMHDSMACTATITHTTPWHAPQAYLAPQHGMHHTMTRLRVGCIRLWLRLRVLHACR